jgi:hypothetical protein
LNIFYLDNNTDTCSRMHCDKHVVKMILEYAQLLSTAHRVLDGSPTIELSATGRKVKRWRLDDSDMDSRLFAATHINHPCAVWARQSSENYLWLADLLWHLSLEYRHRYGREHSVWERCLRELKYRLPKNIATGPFTDPPQAMPDEYKASDTVTAYHNYYRGAKRRFATWKHRDIPAWFDSLHNAGG